MGRIGRADVIAPAFLATSIKHMNSPSRPGALGGAAVVPGIHVLTLRDVRCVPGGPAFSPERSVRLQAPPWFPPKRRGLPATKPGIADAVA